MDIDQTRPDPSGPRARLGWIVALAAAAWIAASILLFWKGLTYSFHLFGDQTTPYEEAMSLRYERAWGIVTVGTPAAIAVFAWIARFRKTGWTFLAIAVALLVLLGSNEGFRDLYLPEPEIVEPGPPGYCVEHSGGDTRCPGG